MMSRPLMTPDELKTLPKGHFILAKTGCCPMQTKFPLFLKWGIRFGDAYEVEEQATRTVERAIADLILAGLLETEQRWRENGGRSSLLYTLKKV